MNANIDSTIAKIDNRIDKFLSPMQVSGITSFEENKKLENQNNGQILLDK